VARLIPEHRFRIGCHALLSLRKHLAEGALVKRTENCSTLDSALSKANEELRERSDEARTRQYLIEFVVGSRTRRPPGRPRITLAQESRPEKIGRYAHEHSPEEAACKFHVSVRTAKQYRTLHRKRYKK
jgi:hypothetical protein